MASRNMNDPNYISYLAENYEKEKWLRMHWVEEHMDELNRATVLDRAMTNYTTADIRRALITACMPSLGRYAAVGAAFKRTAPLKDSALVKIGEIKECEPDMKPITEEERAVLLESKEDYLKLRYKDPPHKKYNFAQTVNMGYGWNLDKKRLRAPVHGRVLKMGRMKGIGPQPDPVHYTECATTFCTNV